jgi:hypothetical protein
MEFAHDGLTLNLSDSADDPAFARFFAGYDRAFVLPDEKEDIAGFRACLALNHAPLHDRLAATYGPFRELCCAGFADGTFIGGANFIAMPHPSGLVSANLNYIYVEPGSRRQGWLGRLVRAIDALIGTMFAGAEHAERLIFIEQNDPVRMSEEDFARDSQLTGLDQFDRLRIWARLGAKLVDFAYVQPPLSAEQKSDPNLLYSVLGARRDCLDAGVLEGHLRRFFGISVLKGASVAAEPAAAQQLASLHALADEGQAIALLDPMRALALDRNSISVPAGGGFRDLVRATLAP